MFPTGLKNIISSETCDPRPLVGGAALSFSGSGSGVEIENSPLTPLPNGFILECNVNISSFSSSINYLFRFADSIGGTTYFCGFSNTPTDFRIHYYINKTDLLNVVSFGEWFNMKFVRFFNGADFVNCLYINNNLFFSDISTAPTANTTYTGVKWIGGRDLLNSFVGQIYGLSFQGNNLGFNDTFVEDITDFSNCVQFYKTDCSTGTTLYDSSGDLINGSITSPNWVSTNQFSYRDNLGFNQIGSIYIPRDESNQDFDVLGNELQNKGKACNI